MTARVSTDGSQGGLKALVLENEVLRAVVLPELGGKLWQLTGKRTGREFLWHNAQLQPGQVPMAEVTGIDADGHVTGLRLTELTSTPATDQPGARAGADPEGASL